MIIYNNTSNAYADIETVYTYAEWEKEYKRNKEQERIEKLEMIKQKGLGIGLVTIGVLGCFIFPEDAGGFVFSILLGAVRTIF